MATWEEDRIAALKLRIAALDQALLTFATDGAQQTVSFDDGQTRLSWNRSDIQSMEKALAFLENQLVVLEIRTGQRKASFYARPGY